MLKKIIIVVLVLVLGGGTLALGYYFSNKQNVDQPTNPEGELGNQNEGIQNNPPQGENQNPDQSGLINSKVPSLSNKDVFDYYPTKDGVIIVSYDGIWDVRKSSTTALTSSYMKDLFYASFSFDGKKVLVGEGSQRSPRYKVFDVGKKSWKELPSYAESPTWSTDSSEIAFLDKRSDRTTLNITDSNSRTLIPRLIGELWVGDVDIEWVAPSTLFLKERASSYYKNSIWSFDIKNGAIKPVVLEKTGAVSVWDKKSNVGLVLLSGVTTNSLTLVKKTGESIQGLDIKTVPDKCSFYSKYMICGVPVDWQEKAPRALLDHYNKGYQPTSDDFIRINTESGEFSDLVKDSGLDSYKVKVFENKVYFINRGSNKLYSFEIKG